MSLKRVSTPTLIAIIVLMGCQEQVSEPVTQYDETTFFLAHDQSANLASLSVEEMHEHHRELARFGESARRVMQTARSWEEADRELRSLLAEAPEASRQFTASRFLESTLLPARVSIERTDAIDFYTRILVRGENPDASIILPALAELRGVWPEEEMRRAEDATLRRAQEYLARNTDLISRAGLEHESAQDAQTVRFYRIKQAIES